jgi:hypothetical protein
MAFHDCWDFQNLRVAVSALAAVQSGTLAVHQSRQGGPTENNKNQI